MVENVGKKPGGGGVGKRTADCIIEVWESGDSEETLVIQVVEASVNEENDEPRALPSILNFLTVWA